MNLMRNKQIDWTVDEYTLVYSNGIDGYNRTFNGDAYSVLAHYVIRELEQNQPSWPLLAALQDVSVVYYSGNSNMMKKARARVRNTAAWRALSIEQRYRVRELFEPAFGFSYTAREAVRNE